MNNEENSTLYYAKLFLLMVIPVYGFFFTALLVFSKDVDDELKSLAKGALIARITFLLVLITLIVVIGTMVFPYLSGVLNKIGVLRLF